MGIGGSRGYARIPRLGRIQAIGENPGVNLGYDRCSM